MSRYRSVLYSFILFSFTCFCAQVDVPLHVAASTAAGGVTTLSFSRYAQTCDSDDLDISTGTTRFIYSFSPQQPTSNSLSFHSHAGTKSVNVFDPRTNINQYQTNGNVNSNLIDNVSPATTANFTVAATVPMTIPFPSPDTSYYCQVFQLPTFDTKHHIIRMSININPPSNVKYVHHLLLYVCESSTFDPSRVGYQGECNRFPSDLSSCLANSVLYGWAVGGEDFLLPANAGLPLGTSSSPRYVVMQTHYNNPAGDTVVDQSGVTIYHTPKLRQYDAGIFWQGQSTEHRFTIPAGKTDYVYSPYCPGQATKDMFDKPIKIFSGLLHMHQVGRSIRTRVLRDGTELKPLMENKYYDFNFQSFETLAEEREILPGDAFITECHYNTESKTTPTRFGESTSEEMCMGFFAYYPATTLAAGARCMSGDYTDLGVGYVSDWTGPTSNSRAEQIPYPPVITTPYIAPACTKKTTPACLSAPRTVHSSFFNPSCYAHSAVLDSASNYTLYWDISADSSLINMAVTVNNAALENTGWTGLGISPTGGMLNSDVVTFWLQPCINNPTGDCVNNNVFNSSFVPQVRDRFATSYSLPAADSSQDVFNVVYYSNSVSIADSNNILSRLNMNGNTCMAIASVSAAAAAGGGSVCSNEVAANYQVSTGASGASGNILAALIGSASGLLVLFFIVRIYRERKLRNATNTITGNQLEKLKKFAKDSFDGVKEINEDVRKDVDVL